MFCRTCLYPLEGIAPDGAARSGRCPECGAAFDPRRAETFLRRPRHPLDSVTLWVLLLATGYAIVWMSIPYLNHVQARVTLGRWPRGQEEGSIEGAATLFILGLVPAMLLLPLVAIALAVALWRRPRGWRWVLPLAIATWTSVVLLMIYDPGYIMGWMID